MKTITMLSAIVLIASVAGTALAGNFPESADIADSPESICPLQVGSAIPQITLMDENEQPFNLNSALAEKPTILIIFRGGW